MAKRLISDFFCVATAGKTADDREIKTSWIDDIAGTYNPNTYLSRIWPDHVRWYGAFGEVVAVMRQEKKEGDQTLLQLFAQIAPSEDLIYFAKRDKYLFPSIEVKENFAGTGKAYLWGLGVTDQPASLSTDRLEFAAQCAAGQSCDGDKPMIFTFDQHINALEFKEVSQNTKFFDVGAWFTKPSTDAPTVNQAEESLLMTEQDKTEFKTLLGEALQQFATDQDKKFDEKLNTVLTEKFKVVDDVKQEMQGFTTKLDEISKQEFKVDDPSGEHAGGGDPDALPDDIC